MNAIPKEKQQALVDRLTSACGGSYSPEVRRRYFITGPQWAAAYEGQAVFHAPTRSPVTFQMVIEEYALLSKTALELRPEKRFKEKALR